MSIKTESIATCSRCGNRTGLTIYKSINISEDPALKEKVKDIASHLGRWVPLPLYAKYPLFFFQSNKTILVGG